MTAAREYDERRGGGPLRAVVSRQSSRITDLEEATELMRREYARHDPILQRASGPFRLSLSSTAVESAAGSFRVDRVRHSMQGRAHIESVSELMITVPRTVGLRRRVGRDDETTVALAPHWRPSTIEWHDVDVTVGVLDIEDVQRVGAELAGIDASAVQFTDWRPVSVTAARFVGSVVLDLERFLARSPDLEQHGMICSEQFRHLAAAILIAFPNTTHTVGDGGDDHGGVATVRRAVQFIDAHARDDIGLGQIAAASRIGVRGLQKAFRAERGQTPTEYLRRTRLAGARDELLDADPSTGVTVAEVAARWGFQHPGRFAMAYRRSYGHPPSDALRA